MAAKLNISFDSDLLEAVSAEFDLRAPNKEALRQLVFTLDGDYDPSVMQVLNLATGVGKTYLMAAFMEYLRRQGITNVVVVTPGKTVQAKTVQNFTPGSPRYIAGSPVPPDVVTPQNYGAWIARANGPAILSYGREVPLLAFVFNIQQLIAPKTEEGDTRGGTQDAMRRKPRRFDENAGVLFDYLKAQDDLVVIADESHLYSMSAAAFHSALKELDPAATIGLTASVDRKADHVIFEYPLYRAIQDRYVKAPVLAFRKAGYEGSPAPEEQQLRDALRLRSLKQAHYDAYAEQTVSAHLNAVAFIVCSDVNHATDVAQLLRTPEFLGREDAVLQIDSKHEDDETLSRLDNLDHPDSPVLAVVSVNKLKEGWDVKNIAVIATLRAMASEVLTQQTMGRGLRLPFGAYTGIQQIDQLDIIAHQSFKELLNAENVLKQFGLEETVENSSDEVAKAQLRNAARNSDEPPTDSAPQESSSDSPARPSTSTASEPSGADTQLEAPGLAANGPGHGPDVRNPFSNLDDSPSQPSEELELVTIERNPAFQDVEYYFPVTSISLEQPELDLSEISNQAIEAAARQVTSTGEVLIRKEVIAVLGKKLRVEDRESAEVESTPITGEDAAQALVKLVVNMHLVPKKETTTRYIKNFLVPRFMKSVTFERWSVKSLASASVNLERLVKNFALDTLRSTREIPQVTPRKMPGHGYTLPLGENVHDQIETREDFRRGRVYGGWFKSLFAEESFDSYSGEYVLAKLLNTSPHIVWWQRLHPSDRAFIYYTARDRYFPDFVALDTDGIHWIIEGKDERGRDDARVQAKRKAAESLVRRLVAEDCFGDQKWGYLIAHEQDTQAADSWDDLKARAQPVTNTF